MAARRWIKRGAIALLALVLLGVGAVATALVLIDTQDLRGVIERRVEAATGRSLTIEGPLDVSLFPWLGFELGRTRLANAEGFGEAPFAALERAELRVAVLPLFAGRVELDRIVLHGIEANLARDAAGRANWADLAGGADGAPVQGEPAGDGAAPEGASGALALRVEAFDLRDATVTWSDAASGQRLRLSGVDLATGPLAPGEPTPLELALQLGGEGLPTVDLEASAELTFELAGPRVRLAGLDTRIDARGEALPGGRLEATLAADVAVDAGAREARIDALELAALDALRAQGAVQAQFADAPAASGSLRIAEFDPRDLAAALDVELPEAGDAGALENASAELDFRATPSRITLAPIRARLDDSTLQGSAGLEPGPVPSVTAELGLDAIDLDRYLPAATGDNAAAGDAGAGDAGGDAPAADPVESLPLEALRGVTAKADLDAGRIGYRGLDMSDVEVRIRLADGVLRLQRAALAAAGGQVGLAGRLDGATDTPAVSLSAEIGGVQAEPLLNALAGAAPVLGRLDTTLAADTRGATLDDWTRALSGRFDATFRDGALRGINLARTLRVAGARLGGGDVETAGAERRTDFSVLRVAGEIRDGVVRSDTLDMRTPLLRVGGKGQADLAERTVDYTANLLVTGTLAGQGGRAASELEGLEVPVRFTGAWLDPKIDVLLDEALKARAERELEQDKAKAEQALEAEKQRREQEVEEERKAAEKKLKRERDKAKEKLEQELEGLFD